MGRMSWEGPEYVIADWDAWWQAVLESDFATTKQIQEEVGPEYLMYFDMESLEPFFQVFP